MTACGVDFGTSNSAVALPDGRVLAIDHGVMSAPRSRLFRSVLYFPEDSREHYAGQTAIDEYLGSGEGRFIQSVKSWLPSSTFSATQIRNKSYRLEELVAMLLRIIRERAEAASGGALTAVTLGRPAVFSPDADADALAERRLRDAAALAGFEEIRFVIEPIAAALSYESRLDHEELVLVADFGAGTSDLTIMRLGPNRRGKLDRKADVIASNGVRVGGDQFDAAIMRHKLLRYFGEGASYEVMGKRMTMPPHIMGKLQSWHEMSFIRERQTQQLIERMLYSSDNVPAIEALQDLVMENLGFRLFRAIERAKIELSTAERTVLSFEEARITIEQPITRAEFEAFTTPLGAQLTACVDDLFARAPIGEEKIDAVFLTGGSSQIPSVAKLFSDRFGVSRVRTQDAFTSVAEGLGIATGVSVR